MADATSSFESPEHFSIPSTTPNLVIINPANQINTIKLSDENFLLWHLQTLAGIRGLGLDRFILNPSPLPPKFLATESQLDAINPAYVMWCRQDQLLFSFLLASMTEGVQSQMIGCDTSAHIWLRVTQLFSNRLKAQVMQYKLQLQTLKKGTLSMKNFLSKMKQNIDLLAACGHPMSDDDQILCVLGGVGAEYDSVVVHITSRIDLISLSEIRKRMAASSSAIQVSCSLQRPPLSPKYVSHSGVSLASPLSSKKGHFPIIHNLERIVKEASLKLLDAFVDLTFEFVDQPLLPSQTNFVPVKEIGASVELTGAVSGTIPDDFTEGVYIRNGSNPVNGGLKSTSSIFGKSSNIWVEGEGMIHALYFKKQRDGTWLTVYNNKYIETDSLRLERQSQQQKQKPAFLPSVEGDSAAVLACFLLNSIRFGSATRNFSNTNIFEHAGKYYSISETDSFGPLEIDINTLQTLGTWDDVRDDWNRNFTSHPKRAPGTGELVTFGIYAEEPYFELGVISADGKKLNHKVDLKFQRCTLCHDIGVTERYNVILDFPTIIDLNRLFMGGSIIKFEKDKFARIGVMPRYGDADSVRWFEVEPCSMFHIINCYEEGDEVIVMGCRARDSIIPGPDLGIDKSDWFSRGFRLENCDEKEEGFGFLVGRPYEWRLNTKTGQVKQRYLVEPRFSMDFPFINDKFTGIKNKYGYTQVVHSTAIVASAIAKYGGLAKLSFEAKQKGEEYIKAEYHMFPENTFCTGSIFVAKKGAVGEDNGWLITFVHNEDTDTSEVYIIDAENFTSEPVARITLPCRVPYGFHGAFLPAIHPV